MRVTLGRSQAGDTLAISVAMMDPQVSAWLGTFPFPYRRDETCLAREDQVAEGTFAIQADGRFAGLVLAAPELGCWVDRKYQGKGIATRAATLALARHFAGGASLAWARCRGDNTTMKPVLARLGFQRILCPSKANLAASGDVELHSLTREDFAAAQPFMLITPRCLIEGVRARDLEEIYAATRSWSEMTLQCPFHHGIGFAGFAQVVRPYAALPQFFCTVRLGARIIGLVGLIQGQVSLWLQPEVSGLGFASEIMPAFCAEVFDRFALPMLGGEVVESNTAAIRVLEKAGFRLQGRVEIRSPGRRPAMGYRYGLSAA